MEEIALQYRNKVFIPHSIEDERKAETFKENQIVKGKISGVQKHRSYKQLKLYWKACQVTAENTEENEWSTRELVDIQCRHRAMFYDPENTINIDGVVINYTRSISFKNLKHIDANGYFDKAFVIMAKYLRCDLDIFINHVKKECGA